tara:strand:- start:1751 stop:3196 length:1446 start_codon:yes stop_codon:yes gene_type:complete
MGFITQFYTWVDGNTITAARSNGNISNIIDGLSDGTKDVNFFNIQIAGNTIVDENKNLINIGNITSLSSTDNNPLWKLMSTNDNANSAELEFYKFSSTPADNDDLGRISFYGDDDGTNKTLFAQILVESSDVTDTTEDGKFTISTMVSGSSQNSFIIDGGNIILSGTLTGVTSLTVDNLIVNGNDISSSSGDITLTPFAGNSVVIDGGASFDGGVVTGITDLTSTNITGTLSTAVQTNVTSLGTLSILEVTGDLTVDTTTLKVDSTNNRVGIGTATPGGILEIYGTNGAILHNNAVTNNNHSFLLQEQGVTCAGIVKYGSTHASQANNLSLKNYANGNLTFHTNSIERMQISSTGKVFMPSLVTSGSGTNVIINPSTGELYEETSSLKFKEKVEDIKIDTSKIYDIQPRTYLRKESDIEEIGFIAEEVNELIPEVVSFKNDAPYSINYAKLVVPIITEMKKLKAEIKELKGKVNSLELSAV